MFKIDVKKATNLNNFDPEDLSLSEAIHTIYDNYSEIDLIHWNELIIRIDRKGDLSSIYNDIVYFIKEIISGLIEFEVSFLSSTFTSEWHIKREKGDLLSITPKFHDIQGSINGVVFKPNLMNQDNLILKVETNLFLDQWKKLLIQLKQDLLSCGYSNDLEDFNFLLAFTKIE